MRRGGHKLIQYALGFSEGVTRGIFKSLVQKKLLKPRRGGSELTEDGIRFLLEIFRKNHINPQGNSCRNQKDYRKHMPNVCRPEDNAE